MDYSITPANGYRWLGALVLAITAALFLRVIEYDSHYGKLDLRGGMLAMLGLLLLGRLAIDGLLVALQRGKATAG